MVVPDRVNAAFLQLKDQYPKGLVLKKIKNGFYVYIEKGNWIKAQKRSRPVFRYLGRITNEGVFRRKGITDLEAARLLIEAHGGKITFDEKGEAPEKLRPEQKDKEILTCLAMNSRLSAASIGKIVSLKEAETSYKIRKLEKQYGIEYKPQLYGVAFGYYSYIVLVRFLEKKPSNDELKAVVDDEPRMVLGFSLKGDEYDFVGVLFDEDPYSAVETAHKLRSDPRLSSYPAVFNVTPLSGHRYGYAYVGTAFLDKVLREHVVGRRGRGDGPKPTSLLEREFNVLKELSLNSAARFADMDRKYNYGKGTSLYTYEKLLEKGIIVRPSMHMSKFPVKYFGVIFVKLLDMSKYLSTRYYLYREIISDGGIVDSYSILWEVSSPDMLILIMPVYGDRNLEHVANGLKQNMDGVEISTSIISDTLGGHMYIRRFDHSYTYYYSDLFAAKKTEYRRKIDYMQKIEAAREDMPLY